MNKVQPENVTTNLQKEKNASASMIMKMLDDFAELAESSRRLKLGGFVRVTQWIDPGFYYLAVNIAKRLKENGNDVRYMLVNHRVSVWRYKK